MVSRKGHSANRPRGYDPWPFGPRLTKAWWLVFPSPQYWGEREEESVSRTLPALLRASRLPFWRRAIRPASANAMRAKQSREARARRARHQDEPHPLLPGAGHGPRHAGRGPRGKKRGASGMRAAGMKGGGGVRGWERHDAGGGSPDAAMSGCGTMRPGPRPRGRPMGPASRRSRLNRRGSAGALTRAGPSATEALRLMLRRSDKHRHGRKYA